ncbi:hypothetical protein P4639_22015 [Priestia megaterium]|uniref:hypothetical protein n=1 Tax=Priestia megaterium TaxID=1404 RepID=UPI002E205063|nr:hypothetical protein [Priestia megaterium]
MTYTNVEMTIGIKEERYMTTAEINITEWITALEIIEEQGKIMLAIHKLAIHHQAIIQKRKDVIDMAMQELMNI